MPDVIQSSSVDSLLVNLSKAFMGVGDKVTFSHNLKKLSFAFLSLFASSFVIAKSRGARIVLPEVYSFSYFAQQLNL